MNSEILNYLIRSGLCTIVFYSFYPLFLSKKKIFRFNRFYLLFSIIISSILPLFNFKEMLAAEAAPLKIGAAITNAVNVQPDLKITPEFVIITELPLLIQIIGYIYLVALAFLFARVIIGVYRLVSIYRNGKAEKREGYTLLMTNENIAPFSIWRTIFINKKAIEEDKLEQIIIHEIVHLKQLHTIDLIIAELYLIIQWFNPAAWLIKDALAEVHEYLADEKVIQTGYDSKSYSRLLVNNISLIKTIPMTNSFSRHLVEKRIVMMKRSKPGILIYFFSMLVLPLAILLAVSVTLNAENKIYSADNIDANKLQNALSSEKSDGNKLPDLYVEILWPLVKKWVSLPEEVKEKLNADYDFCLALKYDWQNGKLQDLRLYKFRKSGIDKNSLLEEMELPGYNSKSAEKAMDLYHLITGKQIIKSLPAEILLIRGLNFQNKKTEEKLNSESTML